MATPNVPSSGMSGCAVCLAGAGCLCKAGCATRRPPLGCDGCPSVFAQYTLALPRNKALLSDPVSFHFHFNRSTTSISTFLQGDGHRRPARGKDSLARAHEVLARAQTVEQLRQAQAVELQRRHARSRRPCHRRWEVGVRKLTPTGLFSRQVQQLQIRPRPFPGRCSDRVQPERM